MRRSFFTIRVKADLWQEASNRLLALRGQGVNVSTEGSGTNVLATEWLDFAGLTAGRDYTATHWSYLS